MTAKDHFDDVQVLTECEFTDEVTGVRRKVVKIKNHMLVDDDHPSYGVNANAVLMTSSDAREEPGKLIYVAKDVPVSYSLCLPSGC